MAGWLVCWRAVEERFASASEALDRWERLDALGREPELLEGSPEAIVPVTHGVIDGEDAGRGDTLDAS